MLHRLAGQSFAALAARPFCPPSTLAKQPLGSYLHPYPVNGDQSLDLLELAGMIWYGTMSPKMIVRDDDSRTVEQLRLQLKRQNSKASRCRFVTLSLKALQITLAGSIP